MRMKEKMKTNMNMNLRTKSLILVVVLIITFVFSYIYFGTKKAIPVDTQNNLPTFTAEQLYQYNGTDSKLPIYIGMNGYVYDVTSGTDFYSKGKTYNYLTGRDSSTELNFIGGKIIEKKYPVIGILIK